MDSLCELETPTWEIEQALDGADWLSDNDEDELDWSRWDIRDQSLNLSTPLTFVGANFSDSYLAGVRGYSGHLSHVDFSRCDLRGADFTCADLRSATFRNADLTGANFSMCDLRGADFRGAKLPSIEAFSYALVSKDRQNAYRGTQGLPETYLAHARAGEAEARADAKGRGITGIWIDPKTA